MDQQNPMEALQGIQSAMQSLAQGIGDQAPPEAMQALQAAMQAYDEFLAVIGGNSKGGAVPAQGGAPEAAGNPNAQPVR